MLLDNKTLYKKASALDLSKLFNLARGMVETETELDLKKYLILMIGL